MAPPAYRNRSKPLRNRWHARAAKSDRLQLKTNRSITKADSLSLVPQNAAPSDGAVAGGWKERTARSFRREVALLAMQLQSGFNEYESGIETIHASLRADAMTANLEIQSIEGRLRLLARRMLSQYPSVGRWDETDDVLQEALVRLDRALIQVSPGSDLHIMRLGALQIRRVLLDLARRYSSSHHFASNHESREVEELMGTDRLSSDGSLTIEDWSEFHRQADQLPPPLREVVDLLWYMGLSQREVADTLEVTERTVQRRWREARLALHQRVCCQDQDRK